MIILEKVIIGMKYLDQWFSILKPLKKKKKKKLFPGPHPTELNTNLLG